jgi:hypothetical protein
LSPCHLEQSPASLSDLERVEELFESSHYDVWVARCKKCGALYVGCYIEVSDASWSFYAQVDDQELIKLRSDYDEARALIAGRRHIVWPPSWRDPYWDEGPEAVLIMGPRP